jgi:hypothetical protein
MKDLNHKKKAKRPVQNIIFRILTFNLESDTGHILDFLAETYK